MKEKEANLTETLGKILDNENIPNSCYNDECYEPCNTCDYNKAYDVVLNLKELKEEDLNSSYPMKNERGAEKVDFDLKTLLKLVVIGDFGSQYKTTSSQSKNFEVLLKLWELTNKGFSKDALEEFWSHKEEKPKNNISELNHKEYQLAHLKAKSFGQIAGHRFDFYCINNKQIMEIAAKASSQLLKIKDFKDEVTDNYDSNICNNLISYAETEEEKEAIIKKIYTIAGYVKNKSYEAITKIDNYELRKVATKSVLFNTCNDKYFNNVLDSRDSIEKLISKRGKSLDIEM